jgi:hypothetical protein
LHKLYLLIYRLHVMSESETTLEFWAELAIATMPQQ